MRSYKLKLKYEGTNYHGWAKQPGLSTIEGILEKKLKSLFGKSIRVVVAGRTDAGVHAQGQVISFKVETKLGLADIKRALNALLPQDIRVVGIEGKGSNFNARFSANAREYKYLVCFSKSVPYYLRHYCWHVPYKLNLARMKKAAQLLVGKHDFRNFSASPSKGKNTVRKLTRILIERQQLAASPFSGNKSDFFVFVLKANGFLHKMVRFIVGYLVETGKHSRQLKKNGKFRVAPPQGLSLVKVYY